MSKYKKQHYVPKCYLKAWCDPECPPLQEPYVWVFSKDGSKVERKAPQNIFYETDMYTIPRINGARDLVLEHGLNGLETKFSSIRSRYLENVRAVGEEERFFICAFISAMNTRTRKRRDHFRDQWQRLYGKMEAMDNRIKNATPEERDKLFTAVEPVSNNGRGLGVEEVKALAEKPLQMMMAPIIRSEAPLLAGLDFAVITTQSKPGFITSDNPCVWYDPQAYKRGPLYRAPGLIYETIEITLPVSPTQLILLNRQEINGYKSVPDEVVRDLNARTRYFADQSFVVCKQHKEDGWFDVGTEQEDSWEKRQSETNT
jgi:hypothetical protein